MHRSTSKDETIMSTANNISPKCFKFLTQLAHVTWDII